MIDISIVLCTLICQKLFLSTKKDIKTPGEQGLAPGHVACTWQSRQRPLRVKRWKGHTGRDGTVNTTWKMVAALPSSHKHRTLNREEARDSSTSACMVSCGFRVRQVM